MTEQVDEFSTTHLMASDESLERYTGTANDVINPVPEERHLLATIESIARCYRVIK